MDSLRSTGKTVHFCTHAALDIATLFALSIPSCIAFSTLLSGPDKISLTFVALLPIDLHQSIAKGSRLSVGFLLSSTFTLNVKKQDKNFRLSPSKITFDRHGSSSLTAASMGTGAIFSAPAVIINSLIRPNNDTIF